MGKHRQFGMEFYTERWDPPLPYVRRISLLRYDPWDMYFAVTTEDSEFVAHMEFFEGHDKLHMWTLVDALPVSDTIKMIVWNRFENL